MINFDDDDCDHDYGFFEYKHWLVGKFMIIDDVDADFLNRLGYLWRLIPWRHGCPTWQKHARVPER